MAKTRRVAALPLPLLLALLALASVVSPARTASADRYAVAVIVGNKEYRSERVPDVAYAHRDAEAFRGYVLDVLGFDPKRVFDLRDATQAEMYTWFGNRDSHEGRLWRYLHPRHGSDVVVFYSGHGVPGLKEKRGYLLPVDADPDTPEINGYPIDLLYANLGKPAEAKTVRVFLDACFSGESDRGMLIRSASPVMVKPDLPEVSGEKLTVLTAASGKEVASWDEKARHGMFTHHLLDALHGKGDLDGDGEVTATEAKTYLDDTMTIAARVEYGRHQTASLDGAVGAVLARAGEDGAFPGRPVLADEEVDAAAVAEPDAPTAEVSGDGRAGKKVVARTEGPSPLAETAESMESGLGLTYEERVLVQHGLASLGEDVGRADGVFGRRTRAGLRSYQKSKGLPETGHLTAELSEALQALGREARRLEEGRRQEELARREAREAGERASDDASFARAKRLNTVAGYEDYLARGGRHESEARELLAEVSKPRWEVGEEFRDCADCPELVVVSSGSYEMGSPLGEEGRDDDEGPLHRVRILERFAVGVYEVRRGEWSVFVEATGHSTGDSCRTYEGGEWEWRSGRSWSSPGFSQDAGHPVVCVSWEDARAYVRWLSRETGLEYRLLSESEWEYVARAGTTTSRYWGNSESGQCRHANGGDRALKRRYVDWKWTIASCDDGRVHTSPVGSFGANGFGLHDVLGNVWEWVEDCWHEGYAGAPADGSAWTSGGDCGRRVLRGGSWDIIPGFLRSADRIRDGTGNRDVDVGFRVARTLD